MGEGVAEGKVEKRGGKEVEKRKSWLVKVTSFFWKSGGKGSVERRWVVARIGQHLVFFFFVLQLLSFFTSIIIPLPGGMNGKRKEMKAI